MLDRLAGFLVTLVKLSKCVAIADSIPGGGVKKFWRDVLVGSCGTVLAGVVVAVWPAAQDWLSDRFTVYRWTVGAFVLLPSVFVYFMTRWLYTRQVPSPRKPIALPVFAPSPLQDNVIRVLRYADTFWLDAEQVTGALRDEGFHYPVSDIDQALRQLVAAGWALDLIGASRREYKLADPGLDYARERGYTVMPFEDVQRVRRTRRGV